MKGTIMADYADLYEETDFRTDDTELDNLLNALESGVVFE